MDFKLLAKQLELDEDEYIELIELFLTTSSNDIANLEKAIKTDDAETAERAAHSLKGSSASLGINDISEHARILEKSAREGAIKNGFEILESIKEKIDNIKKLTEK